MILNCNSCQKKFIVPDNAISEKGRLVQCSACGNKWTQYPEKITVKETKIYNKGLDKVLKKVNKPKKVTKNKKKIKNPYTDEYLKIKHGIKIKNKDEKAAKKRQYTHSVKLGFYSYIIIYTITFITIASY